MNTLTYRGFTLIEIAIVLFLVALLASALIVPIATQVEQRRVSETQRRLEEAREILLGYAVTNKRLPRPAVSETIGTEKTACTTDADCTGVIPWVPLGAPKTDAWDTLIRYSVMPTFTRPPGTPLTISSGAGGTANDFKRAILTRAANGTPAPLADDVVAVIWSHGSKNLGAFEDGTARATTSTANADERCNTLGMPTPGVCSLDPACSTASTRCFYARTTATNESAAGGYFDDQVVWITRSQLINRLVQAGQLP